MNGQGKVTEFFHISNIFLGKKIRSRFVFKVSLKMEESLLEMEKRHEREIQELEEKVKLMFKSAKKSKSAQQQAAAIQMGYDLKAKHREEIENFEENYNGNIIIEAVD